MLSCTSNYHSNELLDMLTFPTHPADVDGGLRDTQFAQTHSMDVNIQDPTAGMFLQPIQCGNEVHPDLINEGVELVHCLLGDVLPLVLTILENYHTHRNPWGRPSHCPLPAACLIFRLWILIRSTTVTAIRFLFHWMSMLDNGRQQNEIYLLLASGSLKRKFHDILTILLHHIVHHPLLDNEALLCSSGSSCYPDNALSHLRLVSRSSALCLVGKSLPRSSSSDNPPCRDQGTTPCDWYLLATCSSSG